MKFSTGTVKKYSREYVRTLKSGEKKKYKTEQIQITVPKQEDIFKNGEKVLIIPESEKDKITNLPEKNDPVELLNNLIEEGKINLNKNEETFDLSKNKEYNSLKKDYEDLLEKYETLANDYESYKNKEKFNEYLVDKFKDFILKVD